MNRFFGLSAYQRPRFVKRFLRATTRTLSLVNSTKLSRNANKLPSMKLNMAAQPINPLQTAALSHMKYGRNSIVETKDQADNVRLSLNSRRFTSR